MKKIEWYQLFWQHANDASMIRLKFVGGQPKNFKPSNAAEFVAVATLLQNNSDVFYDPQNKRFGTSAEVPNDL